MNINTDRKIIVYTNINDKIDIVGSFNVLSVTLRSANKQDQLYYKNDNYIPLIGEDIVAFVLEDGYLDVEYNYSFKVVNGEIIRSPRFNITFNSSPLNLATFKPLNNNKGRYELRRCKFGSFINGNLEGVSDHLKYIEDETVEQFIERAKSND